MKSFPKILFPVISVIIFAVSSCIKTKEYPVIPEIEFVDFIQLQDSALFVFAFKDGDGDIGLASYDTLAPYNQSGPYYYNFFLDYWDKQNGNYVKLELNPPFYYRIPRITPIGQNKTLEGRITVAIPAPYFSPSSDTVKYTAYIYDRAKHKSNEIESFEIAVP